jgi:cytochrome c oxidase subunit III
LSTATVTATLARRSRSSGWWGMALLIASEATLFLLLLATYFYLRTRAHGSWPPAPLADPKLLKPLLATVLLVATSVPLLAAGQAARRGRRDGVRVGLLIALLLGVAFLVVQVLLVRDQLHVFRPSGGAYQSIYYTVIGVHYAHVAVAVLLGIWSLVRSNLYTPERHATLHVTAVYWHFVNAVAIVVFLVLYVSPRA